MQDVAARRQGEHIRILSNGLYKMYHQISNTLTTALHGTELCKHQTIVCETFTQLRLWHADLTTFEMKIITRLVVLCQYDCVLYMWRIVFLLVF